MTSNTKQGYLPETRIQANQRKRLERMMQRLQADIDQAEARKLQNNTALALHLSRLMEENGMQLDEAIRDNILIDLLAAQAQATPCLIDEHHRIKTAVAHVQQMDSHQQAAMMDAVTQLSKMLGCTPQGLIQMLESPRLRGSIYRVLPAEYWLVGSIQPQPTKTSPHYQSADPVSPFQQANPEKPQSSPCAQPATEAKPHDASEMAEPLSVDTESKPQNTGFLGCSLKMKVVHQASPQSGTAGVSVHVYPSRSPYQKGC